MKHKLIATAPYLTALAADFYLLPCLMRDTGSAMLLMLCVMPLIALAAASVCGVRGGFTLLLPAAAFLLFLPTIPLYYNATAWPYAVVYSLVVLAGMAVGRVFRRKG